MPIEEVHVRRLWNGVLAEIYMDSNEDMEMPDRALYFPNWERLSIWINAQWNAKELKRTLTIGGGRISAAPEEESS